jgi:chromosome segregation ATPase
MKKQGNRAQVFTEYVILVAIVAAVLVGIRIYMERAVQQKFRESADVFGEGEQYAKGVTRATYNDAPGTPPITPPSTKDICPGLLSKIDVLESEIKDLNERAESFEQSALNLNNSATNLDGQIPVLREQARQLRILADGYEAQADAKDADALDKRTQAKAFIAQAKVLNDQADAKQIELDDLRDNYPSYCVSNPCASTCVDGGDCCCKDDAINKLVNDIAILRSDAAILIATAADLNAKAAVLEYDAKVLHGKADSLYKAADDADQSADDLEETQVPSLNKQAKSFEEQAADARSAAQKKEDQIAQFKKDYPSCF